ncbi:MAG TPA: alpha-L-rhamnosidase C-terminal domain-containing protein, partial [Victivallales bacterium]|nr:alpha-L-rhamnosidase C-terminal domain-containing protein [Victivallales bacterium]
VIKDESAEYILRTVLDINRHTWVSMGTPYSYFFLAEAISKCKKVVPEAVRCFSEVFRGMLDRGATTTWESWRAENHDSRNHAWSAPMPHLLRTAVVGARALSPGYKKIIFEPVLSAFDDFYLKFMIPQGEISVKWEKSRVNLYNFSLICPPNTEAYLYIKGKTKQIIRSNSKKRNFFAMIEN